MFDPLLVKEYLHLILTWFNIDDIETNLSIHFEIIERTIVEHPEVIESLYIDPMSWNNITSFFHLMIYLNTPTSIKLMYVMSKNKNRYNLSTKYFVKNNDRTIEMDILSPYLRENPPSSITPYRQDVVNFLISLGANINNNNYFNMTPKWILEQYANGVGHVSFE